jgi:hypothetical protein
MELLNLLLSSYFSCLIVITHKPTHLSNEVLWLFLGGEGVEESRHKNIQSRSTSAEVKNAWRYTSGTPYVYVFIG